MNTSVRPRVLTTCLTVAVLALALSACAGDDERAVDAAGSDTSVSSTPASPGDALPVGEQVTEVGTVVDAGDGPQLCLGPISESAPPQCSGIPLEGWDWADHAEFQRQGDVRWGTFGVTGTFDGETFTVERAAPGAEAVMPGSD